MLQAFVFFAGVVMLAVGFYSLATYHPIPTVAICGAILVGFTVLASAVTECFGKTDEDGIESTKREYDFS